MVSFPFSLIFFVGLFWQDYNAVGFDFFMGRYDKMTNNLDNETLKAKSSRMKIQNTLGMIDDLLELTRSILQECDKDPNLNKLAIKYLLNQRQLLEKIKETLEE